MNFFMILFIITYLLIIGMDRYFYNTILSILNIKGLDSETILKSMGFYNKSIFTNKLYGIVIALIVSLIIYMTYFLINKKREKELYIKVKGLEEDLIRINAGDYSIEIKEDDEYSTLRDELYKIIVNLKSMEEESKRQKANLKKDLANTAHQLKTPITSIGFMAELIGTDKENFELYMEKLILELDRLENFTEVLLTLSKLNSNTINYKYEKIFVKEIIEDILQKLNRDKSIKIEYSGEDFTIFGDETWLYEAFLNIIKNSIEYTKDKIVIEFQTNPIYREIQIKDNGKGCKCQYKNDPKKRVRAKSWTKLKEDFNVFPRREEKSCRIIYSI